LNLLKKSKKKSKKCRKHLSSQMTLLTRLQRLRQVKLNKRRNLLFLKQQQVLKKMWISSKVIQKNSISIFFQSPWSLLSACLKVPKWDMSISCWSFKHSLSMGWMEMKTRCLSFWKAWVRHPTLTWLWCLLMQKRKNK